MASVPISTPLPNPEAPTTSMPPLVSALKGAWDDPSRRASALGAIGGLALLGWMFWANLRHFVFIWSTDENYSHGFLVPFISLYFANMAARKGPVALRSGLMIGLALIGMAIGIQLTTIIIPFPAAGDYALVLALTGGCAILAGWEALKRYWFAFFFLIFMIPLPVAFYSMIASPLQFLVSQLATSMLNVIGIPALCEGTTITLPGGNQLFVAEACSGMRQLTGFLALTTAWAYISARPLWHRTLLIGLSIPIAMTANVVRVTMTGVVTHALDPKYASGAFHTLEGLAMMGLGLLMLSTFSWLLDQLIGIGRKAWA